MTYSYSTSDTFTKTHAVYLASKVAADLKQMQLFYGRPSDENIKAYIDELVLLLVNKCLKMVEYGFKRGDGWVVVVRYTVRSDGISVADDRSGRVPAGANISGASWQSFLDYSNTWSNLSQSERQKIRNSLPFQRTDGNEPNFGPGGWSFDKTYSRNGTALNRSVYSA